MRRYPVLLLALAACSPKPAPNAAGSSAPPSASPADRGTVTSDAPAAIQKETLAADTPRSSVGGNTFTAPAGWSIWVQGPATVLETPEPGSRIAIVGVTAKSADEARDLAWAAYRPTKTFPLEASVPAPDRDGWTQITEYGYQVPPNERRAVGAIAMFANDAWTVVLIDIDHGIGEKRGSQLGLIFGRLLPKGGKRESFAGKQAHRLDAARIAMLTTFVEQSMKTLDVPGVSLGLIENGKVVFAGGFGVREMGKPAKVDADTRFIIASNTKALTTLMLAKLVDENKLTWDTAATSVLPDFRLGDADTTSRVLIRHLICACTGMPRQDLEWLIQYQDLTPAGVMKTLGGMQPTSSFGELFQYSNVMAAAAGFLGGHVAYPKLELGKAYDEAMRTRVFEPLGMKATTLDFKRAQTGNFATPHAYDVRGKLQLALAKGNYSVIPVRPAGGAWSSVRDMLRYVQMELAEGKLQNGKAYISKDALLARRAPQIAIGNNATYGMGLMVDTKYGVPVVHHGGDIFGFHSDMMWLPESGVGLVVLTNADNGTTIRDQIQRKLLEVLFDGNPEAEASVASARKNFELGISLLEKQLVIPADPTEAGKLAAHYTSELLGDIKVSKVGAATVFDFGEWKSEMATRKNPDGSISFITIVPGLIGLELVVGAGPARTLVLRDAQHEYTFTERT